MREKGTVMRYVRKMVQVIVVILVAAAVVGATAMRAQQKKQSLAKAPKLGVGPIPVHVVEARSGSLSQSRRYLAVVEPLQTAVVSARLAAEIESIACDEGDVVKAGDVMAVLDSREIRAGIAATEAQILQSGDDLQASQVLVDSLAASVEYWRRELARDQSLREDNAAAISLAEVEGTAEKLQLKQGELASAKHRMSSVQHGVEVLQEKKRELETKLDYCTIRSPFDGVVTERFVDPGDLATSSKSLFRVENRSVMRLVFDVPQQDLSDTQPGLPVVFGSTEEPRRYPLSRLYPSLNADRMMRAEVDAPGPDAPELVTGTYIPVSVELRTYDDATLIPASSLVDAADDSSKVFVVAKNQLALRPVTVLASQHNEVAVSGIQAGEQVVVHTFLGWTRCYPGQKVEVIQ